MTIDHVAEGLSQLPSQFSDSPILKELMKIYLEQVQEIEDVIEDIQSQMNVENAIGFQLDRLGEHLGLKRQGLSDTEYRKLLKLQKILNAGEGQYHTVKQLWTTLLDSTTATVEENFPAGVDLFSDAGTPTQLEMGILIKALPVTVTATLKSSIDRDPFFSFAGGLGIGFGSTEDSSGGKFIGVATDIF